VQFIFRGRLPPAARFRPVRDIRDAAAQYGARLQRRRLTSDACLVAGVPPRPDEHGEEIYDDGVYLQELLVPSQSMGATVDMYPLVTATRNRSMVAAFSSPLGEEMAAQRARVRVFGLRE